MFGCAKVKSFFARRKKIHLICGIYLLLATVFATANLDADEFHVIREPYELLGGDYTKGYIEKKDYQKAASTLAKSYFFHWQYRPLFSPVVDERHKHLFAEEERIYGYVKPDPVEKSDSDAAALYQARLIVPEPDRLYSHGAGKPLLPALLTVPQLALLTVFSSGEELIDLQFDRSHHPLFVLTRIVQTIAGLFTILLVYYIVYNEYDAKLANFAAAICAFFPLTVQYFPNLHQDSVLVPFLLGASYFIVKQRLVVGGILYGLALASKNTAIFLIPAMLLYWLWHGFECYKYNGRQNAINLLRDRSKEFVIVGAISFAILTPFANPVSYATEILTPVIDREFDPRGENVAEFSLSAASDSSDSSNASATMQSAVSIVRRLLGLNNVFVFFVVLAISSLFRQRLNDMSRLAMLMLLMAFPYGLVFGYGLGYRQLMFVPYFSVLCAAIMTRKHMATLTWILLSISVFYCIEILSQW